MSGIGNDIVDWRSPGNAGKSRDYRYLKKILTDVEIEFVRKSRNSDRALWLLWSCKETAYKVIAKSDARAPFVPRCWSVRLNKPDCVFAKGEVLLPDCKVVFVQLYSSQEYVHCTGADNLADLNKAIWGIELLPESACGIDVEPSLFVRECLFRRLADIYSLNNRKMEIRRAKKGHELQPPVLCYENKKAPFDISLSHDERFIAYAFRRL